ncbi:beta-lactamase family protein [Sneathiella marina]|uniref:Beta-lactamase family protein n=1 Tax=Sneathiella marina TaxID=2950108 RepID=A0ABY4W0V2_9PROT|nr:serine hydrolase domain-containing protein [Sneathiella marina]USG60592.1 beta-lactamase family protein [Sneathiella marina]
MTSLKLIESKFNFSALHAAMQKYVDKELLAGVSSAVLVGQDLVDVHCAGWADREQQVVLKQDHIFRVFSNTKLMTSMGVLMLMEAGQLDLDDPIETYLPQLANQQVLAPDATDISQTRPATQSITIRHLLTHQSGLTYAFMDPGSVISEHYTALDIGGPGHSNAELIDMLADVPLVFDPGSNWGYSHGTDVLGRLIEVLSGQSLGAFLKRRIFDPLAMVDTGFWVPEADQARLVALYKGADLLAPMTPGLTAVKDYPKPDVYLKPYARESGGGGLVSTLPDMLRLMRSLMPGGNALLKPETLAMMSVNQLPEGRFIRFAGIGEMAGNGFGLASGISLAPLRYQSEAVVGDVWWGGIAGTQWWYSPKHNYAGLIMAQRNMSFLHPFAAELKRAISDAVVD